MLSAGLITGFVLDEFRVDDSYAMTSKYREDLTVALALGNLSAIVRASHVRSQSVLRAACRVRRSVYQTQRR
jgi:hypothetical protein